MRPRTPMISLARGAVNSLGTRWVFHISSNGSRRPKAFERRATLYATTSLADPKILIAVVSWVLYSFAVLSRRTIGWTGRRAAWLSAIGFVVVLLNFVPVGYFLTRSHNF